jgi:hypothetical protein
MHCIVTPWTCSSAYADMGMAGVFMVIDANGNMPRHPAP